MVLSSVLRQCQMSRSTTTRVTVVGGVILWTVIINMMTSRRPETATSLEGESAPRLGRFQVQAPVPSGVSLPEARTAAVSKSASMPERERIRVQSGIPPAAAQGNVLSAAGQEDLPPLTVNAAVVQEGALAIRTSVPPRNVTPLADEPVLVQKNTPPPTAKAGELKKTVEAKPPPGSHNPLSCFRDPSSAEQRHFSEKEKAMFRYLFDWPEVPTSSCKRMFKMGGLASGEGCLLDGDKHVCLDEPLSLAAAHDDCLIYSFGINYDWSFDEAAEAFGCEVHSFDPSIDYPEGKRSPGITFHHFGIGRNNHTNAFGWQIYTLDQIVNLLGHQGRTIHYLKMDAEGGEFHMLAQQLLDGEGEFVLDKVEQIGFEVHFKLDPHLEMGFYRRANRSVHAMRELGFNLVHWEYNKVVKERYMFPGVERPASLLYEILLIKNGPDSWDRSERGRRQRQVIAALAMGAAKITKSLVAAAVGT